MDFDVLRGFWERAFEFPNGCKRARTNDFNDIGNIEKLSKFRGKKENTMKIKFGIMLALAVGIALGFGIQFFDSPEMDADVLLSTDFPKSYKSLEEDQGWQALPPPGPIRLAQSREATSDPLPTRPPTATPTPVPPRTFTIETIEPLPEEKTALITFSEEVDMDELRNRGDVEPYANLQWWNSTVQGKVLRLKGGFDYGNDYQISFPPKLTSRNGKTYRQTLTRFHMPNRPQTLEFTENKTLIERNSRQMIHLDVVNIDEIQFEGIQIPPIVLPLARSFVEDSTPQSLESLIKDLEEEYTQFAEALSGSEEFKPFLRDPLADKNLFFSPTENNIKKPFSVPLSFRKYPERGTLELLRFKNNVSGESGMTESTGLSNHRPRADLQVVQRPTVGLDNFSGERAASGRRLTAGIRQGDESLPAGRDFRGRYPHRRRYGPNVQVSCPHIGWNRPRRRGPSI